MEKAQLRRTREDGLISDIHDSIQQQVFALGMRVGALKLLLKRDSEAALKNVQEIERLVELVQFDLNVLRYRLPQEYSSSPLE